MSSASSDHVAQYLPEYVRGTLGQDERRRVRAHLDSCSACRAELASWKAVRDATRAVRSRAPAPSKGAVMEGTWAWIEREDESSSPDATRSLVGSLGFRVSLLWQLLRGQMPLVRKAIWTASALVLVLGCAVELAAGQGGSTILNLLAPVVAAAGVGFIYGPANDPPLELTLATPTSPRAVLMARLTLVFGYDLLLALLVSALLAALGGVPEGIYGLVLGWLGAMLLLSALSLGLSVWFGSDGVWLALALWAIKVFLASNLAPLGLGDAAERALELTSSTNALTIGVAAIIVGAVFFRLPYQERLACG